MKLRRKLTALLTALALALTLTACQKEEPQAEFDAKVYVEGLIQGTYLGEFSPEYLELVGLTEEEAKNTYENSLYWGAYAFAYLYSIEYPQEFYEELQELYREIYTHIQYEVISTTRYYADGAFAVQVDIAPIDIVQKVESKLDEVLKPFFEKYPSEVQNTMTTQDYQEFDAEWARLIIDTYKETLPETGNLEKRSVTVKLEKNEEGYYSISSEEFKKLDALVIDYSEPTPEPTETDPQSPEESPAGDPENPPEEDPPEGDPFESPEGDPPEDPGENDPVPPTTASPLPEPEGSEEPSESPTGE